MHPAGIIATIAFIALAFIVVDIVDRINKTGRHSEESKDLNAVLKEMNKGLERRQREERRKTAHIRARVWIAVIVGIFLIATLGYALGFLH